MVAYSILVSDQGPLVLGLGRKGFGLRVWGQGLTILSADSFRLVSKCVVWFFGFLTFLFKYSLLQLYIEKVLSYHLFFLPPFDRIQGEIPKWHDHSLEIEAWLWRVHASSSAKYFWVKWMSFSHLHTNWLEGWIAPVHFYKLSSVHFYALTLYDPLFHVFCILHNHTNCIYSV